MDKRTFWNYGVYMLMLGLLFGMLFTYALWDMSEQRLYERYEDCVREYFDKPGCSITCDPCPEFDAKIPEFIDKNIPVSSSTPDKITCVNVSEFTMVADGINLTVKQKVSNPWVDSDEAWFCCSYHGCAYSGQDISKEDL